MAREWTPLNFGKYKGKTLPWIVFHDPDWFYWACEEDIFKDKRTLKKEARVVNKRSRSIKIPQTESGRQEVSYGFSSKIGRYVDLEIVPVSRPKYTGSTEVFRLSVIDLSMPRDNRDYDKLGYRIFLKSVKFILFGDSEYRMTEKRCGRFFNKKSNFDFS